MARSGKIRITKVRFPKLKVKVSHAGSKPTK
jgi:hypothetical protein